MKTTRKILPSIALLLIIAVATTIFFSNRYSHYKVEVYKSEQGWGYDILINKKTVIHQPYMPSVSGKVAFESKYAAKKTGNLVVKKIKKKQLPTITTDELNSILKNKQRPSDN
ncbi:MAG: DUF4907 domain-containing protein [Bacteroidales bacterium]|nr:DUF4907 domain-containing protein [Bacteroidales bacterium]